MNCVSYFFLTIILLLNLNVKSQDLQINEVVSKNYNGLVGFDGETEDWIEIYNSSTDTINLQDYFLSDDENNLQLWQFPSLEIFPDSFVLVFASDKDIFLPELHSNFKISSKGEKLFLSKNTIVDSVSIPSLKADFSYARIDEQSNVWSLLDINTPKSSNESSNHLSFSHESGFYEEDFTLELTNLRPNHTIYYTLDGSEPTVNSSVCVNSIQVEDRSHLPNGISEIRTSPMDEIFHHNWESPQTTISKINCLKFRSYYGNVPSSTVYTLNFLPSTVKSNLKTICVSIDSTDLFDFNDGIYVPGALYNEVYPNFTGNYFSNKKVQAHFSLFNKNQTSVYEQNCELRVKGNTTRASAQKSLKFFAKKEFGAKYFETDIVEDDFETYNSFILRNTQGSALGNLMSDDFANVLVEELNIDYSKSTFCHVFLNGEYWGIQSLRNELNDDFLREKYNLETEEINIIDIDYETIQGSNQSFVDLISFIESNSLENEANYQLVKNDLDISSYIDYQIAEMFLNNFDWPGNNSAIWCTDEANSKWRFLFYDLDGAFVDVEKNMFEYCTALESSDWRNADEYTFLFRSLLKNENFKEQFVSRYLELIESQFSKESTLEKLNLFLTELNLNIDKNIERWSYPESRKKWLINIENDLVSFLSERPCVVEKQMNEFFGIKTNLNSCTEKEENETLIFTLFPNPSTGSFEIKLEIKLENKYFIGEIDVLIYDVQGALLLTDNLSIQGSDTFKIANSGLVSGIYYVKVIGKNNYLGFQKIIINN